MSHYEDYIRLCSSYKIHQPFGEAFRLLLLQDRLAEEHLWSAKEKLFLADNVLITDPGGHAV